MDELLTRCRNILKNQYDIEINIDGKHCMNGERIQNAVELAHELIQDISALEGTIEKYGSPNNLEHHRNSMKRSVEQTVKEINTLRRDIAEQHSYIMSLSSVGSTSLPPDRNADEIMYSTMEVYSVLQEKVAHKLNTLAPKLSELRNLPRESYRLNSTEGIVISRKLFSKTMNLLLNIGAEQPRKVTYGKNNQRVIYGHSTVLVEGVKSIAECTVNIFENRVVNTNYLNSLYHC